MKKRLIYYLMIATVICSIVVSNTRVFAVNNFYSGNDILFYDPNDTGCVVDGTGGGNLVGNDNTEKALRYFVGKGLTLAQASGIIGNLMAESGVNPTSVQPSGSKPADEHYTPVDGTGFGIAQWTFTSRQQPLVEYAKSSNRSIIDLSMQLDFMWKEMGSNRAQSLTELKKTSDPVDAAISFHKWFEGSKDSADRVRTVRGANAKDIYNKFNTKIPDNTTSGTNDTSASTFECTGGDSSDSSGSSGSSGSGEASSYINGFAIYNQNDSQWANKIYGGTTTIGEAGCGPSAMAMIITALTGNKVTPVDTAKYGASHGTFVEGHGSSHNIAAILSKHWGLKSTGINASETKVNGVLRSGGLVLAVATGSPPYTKYGHFIVIRAVTEKGKWMVGDSNGNTGKNNSSKEWSPSTILDGGVKGVSLWAVTK